MRTKFAQALYEEQARIERNLREQKLSPAGEVRAQKRLSAIAKLQEKETKRLSAVRRANKAEREKHRIALGITARPPKRIEAEPITDLGSFLQEVHQAAAELQNRMVDGYYPEPEPARPAPKAEPPAENAYTYKCFFCRSDCREVEGIFECKVCGKRFLDPPSEKSAPVGDQIEPALSGDEQRLDGLPPGFMPRVGIGSFR